MEGDVQREVEAGAAGGRDEMIEVVKRAQRGFHRGMSACPRADGPGTARVGRSGGQRVVRTLAMSVANGMDRWQVHDVESHCGDGRKTRLGVAEGGRACRVVSARAGKHFVPRALLGADRIHHHPQDARIEACRCTVRCRVDECADCWCERRRRPFRLRRVALQQYGRVAQPPTSLAA